MKKNPTSSELRLKERELQSAAQDAAEQQRAITAAIFVQAFSGKHQVLSPASYPGGFWAKSGPGCGDRGGTWNN